MATLRSPSFDVPEWKEYETFWVAEQCERVARMRASAAVGNARFKRICEELRVRALKDGTVGVRNAVTTAIDVRACLSLWHSDESFRDACTPTEAFLQQLQSITPRFSSLSLQTVISVYFEHFDTLFTSAQLKAVQGLIKEQLDLRSNNRSAVGLRNLTDSQDLLFSDDPVAVTVEYVHQADGTLESLLTTFGLTAWRNGRFIQLCRIAFYIRQLETMPVGDDDPVLLEVSQPSVIRASFGRGLNLGHKVLQILIDRSRGGELSDAWRETILRIGGDPRLPPSTISVQTWWEPIGKQRVQAMQAWMSQLDVGLFLQILEEVGKSSDNSDLQRMFPARHKLLSAILDSGKVVNTRLFLSYEARRYVRREYPDRDLSFFGELADRDKSVIYMQVGNMHLVEGTHNFKLWIYPQLPEKNPLLRFGRAILRPNDLGVDLGRAYVREFGGVKGREYLSETHTVGGVWISRAIAFLRKNGIRVDENFVQNAKTPRPRRSAHHLRSSTSSKPQDGKRARHIDEKTTRAANRPTARIEAIKDFLAKADSTSTLASPKWVGDICRACGGGAAETIQLLNSRPGTFRELRDGRWELVRDDDTPGPGHQISPSTSAQKAPSSRRSAGPANPDSSRIALSKIRQRLQRQLDDFGPDSGVRLAYIATACQLGTHATRQFLETHPELFRRVGDSRWALVAAPSSDSSPPPRPPRDDATFGFSTTKPVDAESGSGEIVSWSEAIRKLILVLNSITTRP